MIPIIDIFAGPGGLGEGFSSLTDENGDRIFKIKLSIEKDYNAYQTLKLRSFFRQFSYCQVPKDYYSFVRREITIEELYKRHPLQAAMADEEVCCGTLGTPDEEDKNGLTNKEVDSKIRHALNGNPDWLLIGGPPCQAYSLVGRSRRKEKTLDEARDKRVGLYKEYLRIIAVHRPAVFVMENVKGLLSAKTETESIFRKIKNDLSDPVNACLAENEEIENIQPIRYRIFSLTTSPRQTDLFSEHEFKPEDFIIKSEEYGIPQKRHRVILLGLREDMSAPGRILVKREEVSLSSVIGNLPKIRSGLSREFTHSEIITDKDGNPKKKRYYKKLKDSPEEWMKYILRYNKEINKYQGMEENGKTKEFPETMGKEFIPAECAFLIKGHPLRNWFADKKLKGILHHESRKHMAQDLKRYLFAARYSQIYGTFPKMGDYKKAGKDLLPDHENAESGVFNDRFRVQMPDIPATTITSHISKDGHYFIHYDSDQVRSFTVREAARVQTFPDNYYFYGGRTDQFHQVGNAVPPYLAYQIAEIVKDIIPHNNEEE
ncbi:MAG: DNA cytosine methyltransferase [Bacteroidales bacterium]|jgi:DNA (cytosine-5)-methyltransferase 1|nr:DNA cytosine methyltransferase [Bacteroidales bacterium]